MRKIFTIAAISLLVSGQAFAQNCVLFGRVVDTQGAGLSGVRMSVSNVVKDETIISGFPVEVRTNNAGWFYISILQGATLTMSGPMAPFNDRDGADLNVPALDSSRVDTMTAHVALAAYGLTIKEGSQDYSRITKVEYDTAFGLVKVADGHVKITGANVPADSSVTSAKLATNSVGSAALADTVGLVAIESDTLRLHDAAGNRIYSVPLVGEMSSSGQVLKFDGSGNLTPSSDATGAGAADFVTIDTTAGGKFQVKDDGVTWDKIESATRDTLRALGYGGIRVYNVERYGARKDSSGDWNSTVLESIAALCRVDSSGILFIPEKYELAQRFIIDWDDSGLIGISPGISGFYRGDSLNLNYTPPHLGTTGGGAMILFKWSASGVVANLEFDMKFKINTHDTEGNGNPIQFDQVKDFLYHNNHVRGVNGHTYGNWWQMSADSRLCHSKWSGTASTTGVPSGMENATELLEFILCSNIAIEYCEFENSAGTGLYIYNAPAVAQDDSLNRWGVQGTSNFRMHGLQFKNLYRGSRLVQAASPNEPFFRNFKFSDCTYIGSFYRGFSAESLLGNIATADDSLTGVYLTDCKFIKNRETFYIHTVDSLFMTDCTVEGDTTLAGNWSNGTLNPVNLSNAWITGNKIFNPDSAGMTFSSSCSSVYVNDNEVWRPGTVGFYFQPKADVVAWGNTVFYPNQTGHTSANKGSGFYVHPSTPKFSLSLFKNFVVDDPTDPGFTYAFNVDAADSVYFSGNDTNSWYKPGGYMFNVDWTVAPQPLFAYVTPSAGAATARIYCKVIITDVNRLLVGQVGDSGVEVTVSATHFDGYTLSFPNALNRPDGNDTFYIMQPIN